MRTTALAACLFVLGTATAFPAAAPAQAQQAQDLADFAQGTWHGDVTSDVRGSSRGGVTIVVRKVGRNLVEISCDYDRIPTVRVAIEPASDMIVSATPGITFLIERGRDPNRLDLSIDQASLIVRR